jgi:hypothetical protein
MSLNNCSLLILVVSLLAAGCNFKEITRLQIENDSLRNELHSQEVSMTSLMDVGVWMDSIDANRNVLLASLKEGRDHEHVSSRLRNINEFVKMSEERVKMIQKALKKANLESSSYSMLVDALKSELQLRVNDVVRLNEEIRISKGTNEELKETIQIRKDEVEEASRHAWDKQEELLLLEARIQAMVDNFKVAEADAYYARARALEETARRTKLAPQKRRETYREAVELYKRSVSLGKEEALTDVSRLEKRID